MNFINTNRKILKQLKIFESLNEACASYIYDIILKNNYKNIYLTGGKSLLLFYENLSLLLKKKNKILNFF